MVSMLLGSYYKFNQISEVKMIQIVEYVTHGMLEGGANIFKSGKHKLICECTQRGCKCSFVLICMVNMHLIIPREPIHKG